MRIIKIICIATLMMISTKSFSTVHVINQTGFTFSPSNLTVNVGDVIRWVWSNDAHTTTSKTIPAGAQTWDSPLTTSQRTFEYTVTVAGTYTYVCIPHESMGMGGSFTAVATTTVEENILAKDFSIYPNPASTFINITTVMKGEVVLSDLLGKTLKKLKINELPINNDAYKLDLSELNNGIYIITFQPINSKKRYSLKFIKE